MDSPPQDISPLGLRLCYHPECKKPLVQREGEVKSRFLRRNHCDDRCARTNPLRRQAQAEKFRVEKDKEAKLCPICIKKFTRKRGEPRKIFALRITCSRPCCDEKRKRDNRAQVAKITKTCNVCNGKFSRRMNGKHVESTEAFKKRVTCSPDCRNSKKKKTHPWEKKGSGVPKPSLPPASPCSTPIPEAPKPKMVEVWRPASLGGPYMREVS